MYFIDHYKSAVDILNGNETKHKWFVTIENTRVISGTGLEMSINYSSKLTWKLRKLKV